MNCSDLGQTHGGWTKFKGNPVMGSPETGTRFDVNVHRIDCGFRMYFSWREKKSVAFSESSDGIHWSDPVIQLGPRTETGWEEDINRNCVIFHEGKYRMWYTGQARDFSRIGYAESSDGIHYAKRFDLPVIIPEFPWEKQSVMNPFVLHDGERNVFRMWYAAGETFEPNAIGYAESSDGILWKKSPLNPIFIHGTESYDQNRVGGCEVVKMQDGSFLMFYIGYENINTARICAARSPDGVTRWQRMKSNPLISPVPGCWDGDACYKPSVLYDEKRDCWFLWYNGRHGAVEYIGMAIHPGYELY